MHIFKWSWVSRKLDFTEMMNFNNFHESFVHDSQTTSSNGKTLFWSECLLNIRKSMLCINFNIRILLTYYSRTYSDIRYINICHVIVLCDNSLKEMFLRYYCIHCDICSSLRSPTKKICITHRKRASIKYRYLMFM